MSWCKALVLAGALLITAACGFQPLYQKSGEGLSAGSSLESIRVLPIEDRIGQELRNHLYDALTPRGQPVNPAWELRVELTESIEHIALEQTSFSTRANLRLTGTYRLERTKPSDDGDDSDDRHSGSVAGISSYNILDSEYATLVAERDARSKAVVILSHDIRRQLAIWLNKQPQ